MTTLYPLYSLRHRLATVPVFWRLGRLLPDADIRGMLLERLPRNANCAEIGVWKGHFSRRIVNTCQPRLLHLVDPWQYQPGFPDRIYGGTVAGSQKDMDAIFEEVRATFGALDNVRIHRMPSDQYLKTTTETFDWVYIDGNHGREAVLTDLELSWQRVRPGGYVTGDDYYWRDSDGSRSVKQAVDSFCAKYGCRADLIGDQFLIRKQEAA